MNVSYVFIKKRIIIRGHSTTTYVDKKGGRVFFEKRYRRIESWQMTKKSFNFNSVLT